MSDADQMGIGHVLVTHPPVKGGCDHQHCKVRLDAALARGARDIAVIERETTARLEARLAVARGRWEQVKHLIPEWKAQV